MDAGRRRQIFALALPIIGGMISQNALNLVDTAMVGRLGDSALAAVGVGSFAFFIAMSVVVGIGVGVQAMAARRFGEGRGEETAVALNGGILLSIVVGLPLLVMLFSTVTDVFHLLNQDPEVAMHAVPYLQVRILAIIGVGINHSFRGYWNGINKSWLYMFTLVFMHAGNVFLNWVFIFGNLGAPALGVMGAGLASAYATYIGTFIYFGLGFVYARKGGFLKGLPSKEELVTMLRLAIPAGLQQVFFFLGVLVFLWIVGKIGTPELAALNVLIQIVLVAILPSYGFGIAAGSLISQALGRGDPDDAEKWGWQVSGLAMKIIGGVAVFGLIFPDFLLGVFLQDPETLALARLPLQMTAVVIAIDTLGTVLMMALLGAGDATRATVVAVGMQWALFLPAAYIIGPVLGYGLLAVWAAHLVYRSVQSFVFAALWKGGKWKEIQI